MKKELSIIIVNYKSDKYLVKCLESIKKYPPKASYEVIVIDNNKDNVGFARGVNKGIRKSRGKYMLLLNPDTQVKEGSIDRLYEFAKGTADAGVVGPRLLNPDGSIQDSVINFPTIFLAFIAFWLGDRTKYEKYAPAKTMKVDVVLGAAFLITPQAIKKVGMLDERYFMYYEDLDYCKRVKKAGLAVYYLPTSEVIHHHGMSGKNLLPDEKQWRRLIPSSKIYHGVIGHYLLNFVIWSGQKWQKLLKKLG